MRGSDPGIPAGLRGHITKAITCRAARADTGLEPACDGAPAVQGYGIAYFLQYFKLATRYTNGNAGSDVR
jgi:hypothetical protein